MTRTVNLGRHEYGCKVCAHLNRHEIEQEFIAWGSPTAISEKYGLSRDSLYRHAHALGLLDKRRRNVRAALERIIERAAEVEVNASAIVQAVATYAKLNSEGRLVERTERVSLNELFARMTQAELERYASDGELPSWFPAVAATDSDSQGGQDSDENN